MEAPRNDLVRALRATTELREVDDADPVLSGHFARFNEWTEINSTYEGRFLERIAPGAFAKTFRENSAGVKVLFNHGHDPSMGNQVLGAVRSLAEDDEGARYEVDVFDGLPPLVMSGLRNHAYGASFRFTVPTGKDDWVDRPERAEHNPDGLPERTLREVKLFEFGPVTFPAYAGATAGVRSLSLTDEWMAHHAHVLGTPDEGAATTPAEPEPPVHSGLSPDERAFALRAFQL